MSLALKLAHALHSPPEERLTRLGAGPVKTHKITRKGNLKPVSNREVRATLRARRRKRAEKLAAQLPARKAKRKLGRGAKKLAAKSSRRHKGAKFPFHPFMLMRTNGDDRVAITTTLSKEQCRDACRLDRVKRGFPVGDVYVIHLTKAGKPVEQVYPIEKVLTTK